MASIFTRIVNGGIPCYKVAENADFLAFLDIHPMTKGHTLIIPKKEVDYIFDLDDSTLASMMLFAKQVARKMGEKIECNRVAIVVIGLEVPHAHIHLIPISKEEDVDFRRPKLTLTADEFTSIAKLISL